MSSLLDRIIDAHGGSRWDDITSITATRHFGGAFWALKGVPGIAEEGRFTVDLDREHTRLYDFGDADHHTDFTPERVEIRSSDGSLVEAMEDPRTSFAGHELTSPWNRLQLAYFTGYAMWTYNTEPRSFLLPGVVTEEIGAWAEPDGQIWERLRVTYPENVATHCPVQTLYADADGILRRRDYDVDIAGGSPSVEYMTEQTSVDGIILPRFRQIFVRDAEGHAVSEPLIVSIRIDDIELS
jgi:hypothetical protein